MPLIHQRGYLQLQMDISLLGGRIIIMASYQIEIIDDIPLDRFSLRKRFQILNREVRIVEQGHAGTYKVLLTLDTKDFQIIGVTVDQTSFLVVHLNPDRCHIIHGLQQFQFILLLHLLLF